jgi:hypothetical protein
MNKLNASKGLIRMIIAAALLAGCLLLPRPAVQTSAQAEPKAGVAVLIDNLRNAVSHAGGK